MVGQGQSGQAIKLFPTRQWFPNTQQSRFLAGASRNQFYLPFWHDFHPLWCETCRECKNVTLLAGENILW